jgi:hypothetical protein
MYSPTLRENEISFEKSEREGKIALAEYLHFASRNLPFVAFQRQCYLQS